MFPAPGVRAVRGSNTTTDHITMLDEAITQLPARYLLNLLITVDGAGASHGLVDHITTLGVSLWRTVHYSIGWELAARERAAIDRVPASAWGAVLDPQGQPRQLEEAGVVELTALLREGPRGDQPGRPTAVCDPCYTAALRHRGPCAICGHERAAGRCARATSGTATWPLTLTRAGAPLLPVRRRVRDHDVFAPGVRGVRGWSGSSGALPRRSPLRTGRAGFPRTSAQASR